MKFLKQFFIFAFLLVTLAVFIDQSYSLPNASDDAEIAEVDEPRIIVKRGDFDCPHNCCGKAGKKKCPLSKSRRSLSRSTGNSWCVCFGCK